MVTNMEELGYRDNRADKGILRSAADLGKHIYRNWFSGNGGKQNQYTEPPDLEIERQFLDFECNNGIAGEVFERKNGIIINGRRQSQIEWANKNIENTRLVKEYRELLASTKRDVSWLDKILVKNSKVIAEEPHAITGKSDNLKYLPAISSNGNVNHSNKIDASFYELHKALGLFGNNGKSKGKQVVLADYALSKPLLLEHKGSAKEKIPDFPSEDMVPFEEELHVIAPKYAFEDRVPFDEEILNLVPEAKPAKSRRKYADKYILNEDMKDSLMGEDTETLAKYFMSIEGVGYKTAAKLLGEVGKSADEKQLRKWYKAVKNKEYGTVEEFSRKYNLMLDELYDSEMEGCSGKPYRSGTMNMEDNEIALQDEAVMLENGGADRYNPTETLAKSLMLIKGMEHKKAGRLLTKHYERIGKEVDFDESQLREWYKEFMKENSGMPQFKNLDGWARYVAKFHGTPEITDKKKGHWIRKRKSKWEYYKQWAPLLIPAALTIVAADISLNYKFSSKLLGTAGSKKPAYTEEYKPSQKNPFDALNLPADAEMQLGLKNEALLDIVAEIKPAAKEILYTVKKGDTLSEIVMNQLNLRGKEIYKKVDSVTEKNKISNKDRIIPGQKIDLSD